MEVPLKLALMMDQETTYRRRRLVSPDYKAVVDVVREYASSRFRLQYVDDECDLVAMSTQEEWEDCLKHWQGQHPLLVVVDVLGCDAESGQPGPDHASPGRPQPYRGTRAAAAAATGGCCGACRDARKSGAAPGGCCCGAGFCGRHRHRHREAPAPTAQTFPHRAFGTTAAFAARLRRGEHSSSSSCFCAPGQLCTINVDGAAAPQPAPDAREGRRGEDGGDRQAAQRSGDRGEVQPCRSHAGGDRHRGPTRDEPPARPDGALVDADDSELENETAPEADVPEARAGAGLAETPRQDDGSCSDDRKVETRSRSCCKLPSESSVFVVQGLPAAASEGLHIEASESVASWSDVHATPSFYGSD
ncbi:hypothetical protein DIPPA_04731 [Diplonema papillatum]|nr:hypothetical protein DIPPA_04731 [Diplonema papillatum]